MQIDVYVKVMLLLRHYTCSFEYVHIIFSAVTYLCPNLLRFMQRLDL